LEKEGFDATILDCIIEGIDEVERILPGIWRFGMSEARFREFIRARHFDLVGLSMIYSSDLPNLYRYAQIVKEEWPKTIVIAGGLHATIYTERFLQDAAAQGTPCVDFVIRGEGETRLPRFLRNLTRGQIDLHQEGLAGWWEGKIFVNPQDRGSRTMVADGRQSERNQGQNQNRPSSKLNFQVLRRTMATLAQGKGISEGHPSSPAALQGRYHSQRVYAEVAGECWADGRIDVRGVNGP
jgi:hypothetical protein